VTEGSGRRRLVLGTHNAHKVEELRRILESGDLDVDLVGVDAFPGLADVRETGATFAENALLKAHAVAAATGLPSIADDSGLCVDALNGMPGVLSARWAGPARVDRANLRLVLDQLLETPDFRLGAAFVCAAAVALPDGPEHVVEGRVDGRLIREPRGTRGFGYDPIFVPAGSTLTMAELDAAAKDAISHRGRAFRALVPVLADLLGLRTNRAE
jgi:XTP/dITP diphosphohydrolase